MKSGAAAASSGVKPDWQQVARAVGGERTPCECRVRHERLVQNFHENVQPFMYAEDRLLLEHTGLHTADLHCALRITALTDLSYECISKVRVL